MPVEVNIQPKGRPNFIEVIAQTTANITVKKIDITIKPNPTKGANQIVREQILTNIELIPKAERLIAQEVITTTKVPVVIKATNH